MHMTLHPPHLVGLGGTLRDSSRSRAAVQAALAHAAAQGVTTTLLDPAALALPMYHPEYALADYPATAHPAITTVLEACRSATAMIWCSPTYHGTVTGVFKNVLDYLELLSEEHPPYLSGRRIGLISINDSKTFSAMSNSVHELRAWLAPTHVLLQGEDFDGEPLALTSPGGLRRVRRVVDEVLDSR